MCVCVQYIQAHRWSMKLKATHVSLAIHRVYGKHQNYISHKSDINWNLFQAYFFKSSVASDKEWQLKINKGTYYVNF